MSEGKWTTDDLLDAALDSYPCAPLPPDFTRQVMAQLPPVNKPTPILGYLLRLYWIEFSTAVILTLSLYILCWNVLPWQPATNLTWLTRLEFNLRDGQVALDFAALWSTLCLLIVLAGEIALGVWFWLFWSERTPAISKL